MARYDIVHVVPIVFDLNLKPQTPFLSSYRSLPILSRPGGYILLQHGRSYEHVLMTNSILPKGDLYCKAAAPS